MIQWLPMEIKLHILQFLDTPSKKQVANLQNRRIIFKSYSSIRLVSRSLYLAENTSRCRFCTGRYNYFKKNITKCYCCGHVINSKNFNDDFKKLLFNNRANILGKIGLNYKLFNQYHIANQASDELSNDIKTFPIQYTITFLKGPLFMVLEPNQHDEVEVCGFIAAGSGKPGPAELCGQIEHGDRIVAVNEIKIVV